ncbi:MAG: MATE family efflux transporter, partial [Gammaproteobacteria bacterium]|nr:MATE family efflux transporter [Gammaproteobacteria bacterium]
MNVSNIKPPFVRHDITPEIRGLLSLGLPIMVTQLLLVSNTTIALIMMGRVGAAELAAVGLGTALWIFAYLGCLGLLMALSPTIAQHHGAARPEDVRRSFQQGLWLALIVGLLAWLLVRHIGGVTILMRVDSNVIPLVKVYLEITAWSMPPTCVYFVFRFLCEGTGHSRPMMLVQILLLPVAIGLNWILIYGHLGIPAMGVGGAALSATIQSTLTALCMAAYVVKTKRYQSFNLFRDFSGPDVVEIVKMTRLGLPIAVTMVLDSSFFSVIALLMGQLGHIGLAAHQVVLNYATIVFMIPVGLSSAIMVRVGQSMGRGEVEQARFRGWLGMAIVVVLLVPFTLLAALVPEFVIHIYTRDSEVVPLAVVLMTVVSGFVVFDGLKIAGEGALRGMKETTSPMIISLVSYWFVGFPVAWLLGFNLDIGAVGL